jgi:hypothetical protein
MRLAHEGPSKPFSEPRTVLARIMLDGAAARLYVTEKAPKTPGLAIQNIL